jgi:hypothetical protein
MMRLAYEGGLTDRINRSDAAKSLLNEQPIAATCVTTTTLDQGQSDVALFGPRTPPGRRRADRHPYLGTRLGYFVIRLLNLSLLNVIRLSGG